LKKVLLSLAAPALALVLALSSGGGRPATAQSAGEKVVGGPYVVNAGARTATVMWVVQSGQASLGAAPDKLDRAMPVLRAERAVFGGLRPGTTYYYEAFPGEAGKGSFKTAPTSPTSFQFVVYGDTRTRHDVHRTVVNAILKYSQPEFIFNTGDLVADGVDASLWPTFFDIERELLRKTVLYPTPGNHEHNAANYYDFMNAKPYYSFDWGQAHFTMINSDLANAGATKAERDAFWQEQTRWLEADLQAAQKSAIRFVGAHHPPMTAVKSRQGESPHMIALEPMFEKYGVTAAFFGHDHNYQHYLKNGVHYVVSGGGGAPLYDVDLPPAGITVKVETTENFVVVKVDGGKAHAEARKPNGETIDVIELGK
jgi:acid phosphatase type 7